jgi:hypothetical protein
MAWTGNLHRPTASFDKLVFILLAAVGVVARQQREIDSPLHVPVRFIDQGQEVAMVLLVGSGNMKIAEVNPGNLVTHAGPQCFAINAMPPTISDVIKAAVTVRPTKGPAPTFCTNVRPA